MAQPMTQKQIAVASGTTIQFVSEYFARHRGEAKFKPQGTTLVGNGSRRPTYDPEIVALVKAERKYLDDRIAARLCAPTKGAPAKADPDVIANLPLPNTPFITRAQIAACARNNSTDVLRHLKKLKIAPAGINGRTVLFTRADAQKVVDHFYAIRVKRAADARAARELAEKKRAKRAVEAEKRAAKAEKRAARMTRSEIARHAAEARWGKEPTRPMMTEGRDLPEARPAPALPSVPAATFVQTPSVTPADLDALRLYISDEAVKVVEAFKNHTATGTWTASANEVHKAVEDLNARVDSLETSTHKALSILSGVGARFTELSELIEPLKNMVRGINNRLDHMSRTVEVRPSGIVTPGGAPFNPALPADLVLGSGGNGTGK